MTRSLVILALAVAIAAPAAAQQLVPVGTRVSVRLGESRRQPNRRFDRGLAIRGEVTAESADSLWVRPTRVTGSVGISKAGIRRMYQSRGAPSRVRSLVVDGIAGALLGALEVWLVTELVPNTSGPYPFDATSRVQAIQRGALYGAAFTGTIGFLFPVEYWRRVWFD